MEPEEEIKRVQENLESGSVATLVDSEDKNDEFITDEVEELRSKLAEAEALLRKYDDENLDLRAQLAVYKDKEKEFEHQLETLSSMIISDGAHQRTVDLQRVYDQLLYKDSRIVELNNQILEKERQIMDLQEAVREQGEVALAKSKAVQIVNQRLQEIDSKHKKDASTETDVVFTERNLRTGRKQRVNSPGRAVPQLRLGANGSPPPLDPAEDVSSYTTETATYDDPDREWSPSPSASAALNRISKKYRKKVTFDLKPPGSKREVKIKREVVSPDPARVSMQGVDNELAQQIIDLTNENDELRRIIAEIERAPVPEQDLRIAQLEEEIENVRRNAKNQLLRTRATAQAKLKEMETKIFEIQKNQTLEVDSLNATNEALKSGRDFVLEENAKLLEELNKLKQKESDLLSELDGSVALSLNYRRELDTELRKISELRQELKNSQIINQQIIDEKQVAYGEVEKLKEALFAQDELIKMLEGDLIVYETQVGLLRDSLGASKTEAREQAKNKAVTAVSALDEEKQQELLKKRNDEKLKIKALHVKVRYLEQERDELLQWVQKHERFDFQPRSLEDLKRLAANRGTTIPNSANAIPCSSYSSVFTDPTYGENNSILNITQNSLDDTVAELNRKLEQAENENKKLESELLARKSMNNFISGNQGDIMNLLEAVEDISNANPMESGDIYSNFGNEKTSKNLESENRILKEELETIRIQMNDFEKFKKVAEEIQEILKKEKIEFENECKNLKNQLIENSTKFENEITKFQKENQILIDAKNELEDKFKILQLNLNLTKNEKEEISIKLKEIEEKNEILSKSTEKLIKFEQENNKLEDLVNNLRSQVEQFQIEAELSRTCLEDLRKNISKNDKIRNTNRILSLNEINLTKTAMEALQRTGLGNQQQYQGNFYNNDDYQSFNYQENNQNNIIIENSQHVGSAPMASEGSYQLQYSEGNNQNLIQRDNSQNTVSAPMVSETSYQLQYPDQNLIPVENLQNTISTSVVSETNYQLQYPDQNLIPVENPQNTISTPITSETNYQLQYPGGNNQNPIPVENPQNIVSAPMVSEGNYYQLQYPNQNPIQLENPQNTESTPITSERNYYQVQYDGKNTSTAALEAEFNQLKSQYSQLYSSYSQMQGYYEAREKELIDEKNSLNSKLENLSEKLQKAEKSIEESFKESIQLENECFIATEKSKNLENMTKNLKETKEKLSLNEQELIQLRNQMERMDNDYNQLRDRNKKLEYFLNETRTSLSEAESARNNLASENCDLRKIKNELENIIDDFRKKYNYEKISEDILIKENTILQEENRILEKNLKLAEENVNINTESTVTSMLKAVDDEFDEERNTVEGFGDGRSHTVSEFGDGRSHTVNEFGDRKGHTVNELGDRRSHTVSELGDGRSHTVNEFGDRKGHTVDELENRGHTVERLNDGRSTVERLGNKEDTVNAEIQCDILENINVRKPTGDEPYLNDMLINYVRETNNFNEYLSQDVESLFVLNNELASAADSLKGQVWALNEQLKKSMFERQEILEQMEKLEGNNTTVYEENQRLRNELQEQEIKLIELKEQNHRWQEEVKILQEKKSEVEFAYGQLSEKYEKLQNAYDNFMMKLTTPKLDTATDPLLNKDYFEFTQEIFKKYENLELISNEMKNDLESRNLKIKNLEEIISKNLIQNSIDSETRGAKITAHSAMFEIKKLLMEAADTLQNLPIDEAYNTVKKETEEKFTEKIKNAKNFCQIVFNEMEKCELEGQQCEKIFKLPENTEPNGIEFVILKLHERWKKKHHQLLESSSFLENQQQICRELESRLSDAQEKLAEFETRRSSESDRPRSPLSPSAQDFWNRVVESFSQSCRLTAEMDMRLSSTQSLIRNALEQLDYSSTNANTAMNNNKIQFAILAARLTAKQADNDALFRATAELAHNNVALQNQVDELEEKLAKNNSESLLENSIDVNFDFNKSEEKGKSRIKVKVSNSAKSEGKIRIKNSNTKESKRKIGIKVSDFAKDEEKTEFTSSDSSRNQGIIGIKASDSTTVEEKTEFTSSDSSRSQGTPKIQSSDSTTVEEKTELTSSDSSKSNSRSGQSEKIQKRFSNPSELTLDIESEGNEKQPSPIAELPKLVKDPKEALKKLFGDDSGAWGWSDETSQKKDKKEKMTSMKSEFPSCTDSNADNWAWDDENVDDDKFEEEKNYNLEEIEKNKIEDWSWKEESDAVGAWNYDDETSSAPPEILTEKRNSFKMKEDDWEWNGGNQPDGFDTNARCKKVVDSGSRNILGKFEKKQSADDWAWKDEGNEAEVLDTGATSMTSKVSGSKKSEKNVSDEWGWKDEGNQEIVDTGTTLGKSISSGSKKSEKDVPDEWAWKDEDNEAEVLDTGATSVTSKASGSKKSKKNVSDEWAWKDEGNQEVSDTCTVSKESPTSDSKKIPKKYENKQEISDDWAWNDEPAPQKKKQEKKKELPKKSPIPSGVEEWGWGDSDDLGSGSTTKLKKNKRNVKSNTPAKRSNPDDWAWND